MQISAIQSNITSKAPQFGRGPYIGAPEDGPTRGFMSHFFGGKPKVEVVAPDFGIDTDASTLGKRLNKLA